jgi:hypothetical protein
LGISCVYLRALSGLLTYHEGHKGTRRKILRNGCGKF